MKAKIIMLTAIMCIMLGGCGFEVQDIATINNDIEKAFKAVTAVGEIIESYQIIERQTDEESLLDTILCEIISSDGFTEYTKYFELEYEMNEDDEWVIENFEPRNQESWSEVPLTGVANPDIKSYLIGKKFDVDGVQWKIDESSIGTIEMINRSTDLENRKDSVTFAVELLSTVLMASGELQATYIYNGGWYLDSVSVVKGFEASYQEGKELIMTEKMLLDSLTEVAMEFGEQSIGITEQEITDLSIGEIAVSNVGTQTTCSCSFILNKSVAQFSVSAVVDYAYNQEHGWMLQNINYTKHKLEALHLDSLKGKWVGEIADLEVSSYTEHAMNFEITEVDNEEGTMKASLSIPSEKRSCYLDGYVNFIDLSFTFVFSEWIEKPKRNASMYQPRLEGEILVSDGSFKCYNDLDTFKFEMQMVD